MRGRPSLTLLLLALATTPLTGATPPTPISGEVDLAGTGAWTGGLQVTARDEGAMSIAHGRDAERIIVVEWSAARGFLVQMGRSGTPAAGGYYVAEKGSNETLSFGAGRVIIQCRAGCEALLTGRPGATLALAGRAAGPLAPGDLPREFAGWSRVEGGRDDFYYRAPDAAHAIGGGALADAQAQANGALGLFVDHATVTVEEDRGARTIELGRIREPIGEGPVTGLPLTRIRDRFLVLDLQDASWRADETDAILYTERAEGRIDGTLVARDAVGEVGWGATSRELSGERLTIEGVLGLGAIERRLDPGLLRDEREGTRLTFSGVATRVTIGDADLPAVLAGSSAALPLAVAAAIILGVLVAAPWLPFYSRLQGGRLLENPTRARLMEALRTKPGLTPLALARDVGVARAVVLHHLAALKAHHLVVERRVGWSTLHFVAEMAPDREALFVRELLVDDTRRRIARELAGAPVTQADLVAATGVQQRLVSYHLAKLQAAGLIDASDGRPRRFAGTPRLREALVGRT